MHRNVFQKHFKRHQVAFFFFLLHLMPKLIFLCLKLASFCFLFTIQFNFSRIASELEEKNIYYFALVQIHAFFYLMQYQSCYNKKLVLPLLIGNLLQFLLLFVQGSSRFNSEVEYCFIHRISAFFLSVPKSHKNMQNFISYIECFLFFLGEIEGNFL